MPVRRRAPQGCGPQGTLAFIARSSRRCMRLGAGSKVGLLFCGRPFVCPNAAFSSIQRKGTFFPDVQRYPSVARRLRPVCCKGLLDGRPVRSPARTGAASLAAPTKRPQV